MKKTAITSNFSISKTEASSKVIDPKYKATVSAADYNVFWYDQNIENNENQEALQQLRDLGFNVYPIRSVREGQGRIDKWLSDPKYRLKTTLHLDTIVISSGSYKQQVIDKV